MSPSPLDDDEKFRRAMALLVTCWVMMLLTCCLTFGAYACLKHISYEVPEYFVQICQGVVFGAVFILGVTTSGVVKGYLSGKSDKIEKK